MTEEISKERRELPEPETVSLAGVRYEALPWGKARGLGQNGGYIVAIDEATGLEKWMLKVYDVTYDHEMEEDKQDVFIRKMAWGRNKRSLSMENDRGKTYILDLRDLSVKVPISPSKK